MTHGRNYFVICGFDLPCPPGTGTVSFCARTNRQEPQSSAVTSTRTVARRRRTLTSETESLLRRGLGRSDEAGDPRRRETLVLPRLEAGSRTSCAPRSSKVSRYSCPSSTTTQWSSAPSVHRRSATTRSSTRMAATDGHCLPSRELIEAREGLRSRFPGQPEPGLAKAIG